MFTGPTDDSSSLHEQAASFASHLIGSTEGVTFPDRTIDPPVPYSAKVRTMDDPKNDTSDILQDVRDAGNWLPVAIRTVENIIAIYIRSGDQFPDDIALMDLHYWIDKGSVKPHRYYAARWQWGPKRVYNLFVRLGIYQENQGSTEGAEGEHGGSKKRGSSKQKQGLGEQAGSKQGATGEQYIQTQTDSEELSSSSSSARPRDGSESEGLENERPAEYDPFLLGNGWPKEDQVRAWAAQTGIPPDAAWEIAQSLENIGWVNGNGICYRRWDVTIKAGWNKRQKDQQSTKRNGSHQQTPTNGSNGRKGTRTPEEFRADVLRKAERKREAREGAGSSREH